MIKRISKTAIFITALIICMIPKNTGATSNSVTITTPANACYDQATGIVTVEGTISSSNADVTVLAARSAVQITDAQIYFESETEIENKIVYIDQIGVEDFANYAVSDDGTASWQVSFAPKPGVSGGWITVFVGGTDVDTIQFVSFSAQVAAPGISANPWYKGDDLVMKIHKAGDVYASYGDASAITAWGNAIEKVLVNGSEFSDYAIDSSAATITFVGLESVSSIKITTIDGIYAEINMYGLILAPAYKPAGTITAVTSTVVENDMATVSFNLNDSVPAGWLAGVNENVVTYMDSVADFVPVTSYDLTDGVLTVGIASVGSAESKIFTVKIAVPDYEEKTANVTVISPTRAALDAFSTSNAVSGYKNPDAPADSDYGVTVITPYQGLYSSSVTWELQKMDLDGWAHVAVLISGTEYMLGRTNTAYTGGEYRVLATITNGAYSPSNWSKSFSVYPYGVSDEATLSFIVANSDTSKTDIYEGDTFTVTTVISGLSTWAGAQLAFNYDPQKIMLLSETPVYSVASDTNKYMTMPPSFSEGFIDYTVVLNIINNPNTSEAITNDFQVVSFEFKALRAGSMGLAFSPDQTIVPVNLDINAVEKFTSQAFEVLEFPPIAPSASELTFEESELRLGYTAHADFKFSDQNADDGEGTHIYTWYIDGAVVEGVTGSEFVISNSAYVGKKLTFSVLPVSDNPNDPKAEEAYMTDGYLILANADFKPTVQYEAPAKITAFEEAEVEVSLIKTFENMTDRTVVNWYTVDSSDSVIEDGAIPVVSGSTTATFVKGYNGKYAIIELIPRATVAGEQFQGMAVYSNAIKITANAAATPLSPVILDYTNNSITIAPTEGYEYSINGTDWYSSAIFNELLSGTVYYVYQRVAETEYLLASDASAGTMVTLFNSSYNVEFKNYDGTLLQKTSVSFGALPDYDGNTPEKPASEQYNYTFSGWSPQFQAVKQDAVYEAQFTESLREYTITFKNYDNSILQNYTVEYGSIPQYTGETPVKPSSVQYYYTFSGWTPEVVAVTGEMVYTAQYISNLMEYDVTFIYENNKNPNTTVQATYGYTINAPQDPVRAGYTFLGWYETYDYGVTLSDQPFVFSEPITKEIVLCAKWRLSEDAAEFINGKMVVVSTSAYSDATVMIASYKGNRLISTIKIVRDLKIGDNLISNEELSGFTTENADMVKVIIWKQVSNLKPLKEVIKIKLS